MHRFAPFEPYCERHGRRLLGLVLLAAFAVRAIALYSFTRSIYGAHLMPDEQVYDLWARELLAGRSVPYIYDFPKLPVYVFAALYRVFGEDSGVVRAFNLVLGTATCGLLYLTTARLWNRYLGIVAALLSAFYGPFVLFSVTAHNTALGLFLFCALLASSTALIQQPSIGSAALAGLLASVTAFVRPNAIAVGAAIAVLLLLGMLRDRSEPRRIARVVGAYGLSLVLSLLIGARMMGAAGNSFAGLPEPGFNLYIANTLDNDSAYFRPVPFASADPSQQATGFVVEASRRAERKLSVAEARAYWIDETWREWRGRPGAAARKVYEKVLASLNRYEAANNHDLQFIASHVRGLRLGFLSFPWLLGLAAVGLLRAPNKSRSARVLALLAFCYWLTLLAFFADNRIRAALAAALIPFSALGIAELIATQLHEPKRLLSFAWPGVLAAAVTFLPCRGASDASTALNFHALFLFEGGDLDAAESFYERSTQTGGRDAESAYLGLAAIAEKRGDLDAAVAELERIPDDHYKAADKYLQLGSIMARRNQFEPAITAFEKSLSINSSTLQIYPVLQLLYEKLGRREQAASAARRYAFVQSFYDAQPGS